MRGKLGKGDRETEEKKKIPILRRAFVLEVMLLQYEV